MPKYCCPLALIIIAAISMLPVTSPMAASAFGLCLDANLVANFLDAAFPMPAAIQGQRSTRKLQYCPAGSGGPSVIILLNPNGPLSRDLEPSDCSAPLGTITSDLGPAAGDAIRVSIGWEPWRLRFTVKESTQPSFALATIDVPTDNVSLTLEDGTVSTFKYDVRFRSADTAIDMYDGSVSSPDPSTAPLNCKISAPDNEDVFFYASNSFLSALFKDTLSSSVFKLGNVGQVSQMSYKATNQSLDIGARYAPNGSIPETQVDLIWRGDPLAFDHIDAGKEDCSSGPPSAKLACLARNAARSVLVQLITQKYHGRTLQPMESTKTYQISIGGQLSRVRGIIRKLSLVNDNLEAHGYLVFERMP